MKNSFDILLHCAGAALLMAVFCGAAIAAPGLEFIGLLINFALWPAREALQNVVKGREPWVGWSLQKHLEAWAPVAVSLVVLALFGFWRITQG